MNILNIGRNSMLAHKKALEVTSNNIANANKEGYGKQRVEFQDQFGLGGVGRVNVSRIVNDNLVREMQTQKSLHSKNEKFLFNISNLNNKITNESHNINNSFNNLFKSFQDATINSENLGVRNNIIEEINSFQHYFKNVNQDLINEEKNINTEITTKIQEANGIINNIYNINKNISENSFDEEQQFAAKDERDRLVNQLSEILEVEQLDFDNGSSAIYLKNGEPLILENKKMNLQPTKNEFNDGLEISLKDSTNIKGREIKIKQDNIGGELQGLIDYRDNDLKETKNDLNRLYSVFSEKFNSINNNGYDLNNTQGQDIFNLNNSSFAKSNKNNLNNNDIQIKFENGKSENYNNSTYEIEIDNDNGSSVTFNLTEFQNGDKIKTQYTINKNSWEGSSINLPNGIELHFDSNKPYSKGDKFKLNPNESTIHNSTVNITNGENLAFSSQNNIQNNDNLISFVESQFKKVGKNNTGNDNQATLTFQDIFNNRASLIGNSNNNAKNNVKNSEVYLEQSMQQVKNSSRVNIEEEIVNMEMYQQGYEASARLIEVSQKMFDTLINSTK